MCIYTFLQVCTKWIFFSKVITVISKSLLVRDSQFMFTAGGGDGNNDVKKVTKKVHESFRIPGPAGSGGVCGVLSADLSELSTFSFCEQKYQVIRKVFIQITQAMAQLND